MKTRPQEIEEEKAGVRKAIAMGGRGDWSQSCLGDSIRLYFLGSKITADGDCSHEIMLSCVWLIVAPWTVAWQAPLSMELSRQEYWSGLPIPSPGDLHNPGIELTSGCHNNTEQEHRRATPKSCLQNVDLILTGGQCLVKTVFLPFHSNSNHL